MGARRAVLWRTIAVSGAVLGAIGTVALISSTATGTSPARVALIGDSYAVGLGPELAKLLPTFQYEGHVGTNTAQWANLSQECGQCGSWIEAFRPTVVLVSLGVNDRNAPSSENYQTIVRRLHGSSALVVWIQPPAAVSVPDVRRVISSLGVPVVPATSVPLAPDGLHPQGYGSWAREIARTVSRG